MHERGKTKKTKKKKTNNNFLKVVLFFIFNSKQASKLCVGLV